MNLSVLGVILTWLNLWLIAGAILGIAGAGFAAFRLDSGFREMMREGLVKARAPP